MCKCENQSSTSTLRIISETINSEIGIYCGFTVITSN